MPWDNHSLLARTLIANAPRTAGTSFELSDPDDFAANQYITFWHISNNGNVKASTAEVGRITALDGNVATVTRVAQGTNNVDVFAGGEFIVINALTPAVLEAMELVIDNKASLTHDHDDRYYTESEMDTALAAKADADTLQETVRDTIGTALVAGSNVTLTVNDGTDTITISSAGAQGEPGTPGEPGADGVGVPAGGTTGQALVKATDTDYDTEWTSINSATWGNISGTITDQTDLTTYVDNEVAALVDASPATLDTLNELAAALGDDPNFATTVTTSIGTKATGAASSTDNAVARFDGTTGKIIQNSTVTVNDGGGVTASQVWSDEVFTDSIEEKTISAGVTVAGVVLSGGAVDGVDVSLLAQGVSDLSDEVDTKVTGHGTANIYTQDTEPASPVDGDIWVDESTSSDIVTTGGTQILTGKTMDGDDNTFQDIPASAIKSEAWTSWTPTWYGSSVNPSIGNGTLSGRYVRIGRTIHATLLLKIGSTTTLGTGDWIFTLPVAAVSIGSGIHRAIGTFYAEDAGVKGFNGLVNLTANDTGNVYSGRIVLKYHDAANNAVMLNGGASAPFAWAINDYFAATFTYEAAS